MSCQTTPLGEHMALASLIAHIPRLPHPLLGEPRTSRVGYWRCGLAWVFRVKPLNIVHHSPKEERHRVGLLYKA